MTMDSWSSFFVAEVSASAALTGLIFVGVSINLSKVIGGAGLPGAPFEAVLMLMSVLVISSLMLVPYQPPRLPGIETFMFGALVWSVVGTLQLRIWRAMSAEYHRPFLQQIAINQGGLTMVVLAGLLTTVFGPVWLYLLVPGLLLCIVGALLDAWVLLIDR